MEKVISISGKDVGFKAAASLPVRYYNATGRDLFVDLQTLADGTDTVEAKPKFGKKKPEETQYRLNRDWNTMVLYGIVHTMARAYDGSSRSNHARAAACRAERIPLGDTREVATRRISTMIARRNASVSPSTTSSVA